MSCQNYYGMPSMYIDMYDSQKRLMDMYPDVYHKVYPKVKDICGRYDIQTNPRMYPNVDPSMLQQMVDEAYYMDSFRPFAQQYGGGIFRDLLSILFIRELLGRRRRRPYGYGPYGGTPFGGTPFGGGPFGGSPFPGY